MAFPCEWLRRAGDTHHVINTTQLAGPRNALPTLTPLSPLQLSRGGAVPHFHASLSKTTLGKGVEETGEADTGFLEHIDTVLN